MAEYLDKSTAVDEGYLTEWYIFSVAEHDDEKLNEPRWTEAHINELANDFIVFPKDTPAADVAPVVHGHWIYQPSDDDYSWRPWLCSNCNNPVGKNRTMYCPHCGAKMDEEG